MYRLAQPHVIGETGTQAQRAQIDQPAYPAPLIRAELTDKADWLGQRGKVLLVLQSIQCIGQPPFDIDPIKREQRGGALRQQIGEQLDHVGVVVRLFFGTLCCARHRAFVCGGATCRCAPTFRDPRGGIGLGNAQRL